MSAQYFTIAARTRPFDFAPVSPADFVLEDGVDADAAVVLADPTLTLYSLDLDHGRALFVETPPEVDLTAVPFMYLAQHEHAVRVLAVPLPDLHRLAADVPVRDEQITFIFSTSRCGSTLVSAAFGVADETVSYSEPDVFTLIGQARKSGTMTETEYIELIAGTTRLLCRQTTGLAQPKAWVVKFRAQELYNADRFHAAFPGAAKLYLYRNADTWLRSVVRAFVDPDAGPDLQSMKPAPEQLTFLRQMAPLLDEYLADANSVKTMPAIVMLIWLSNLDRALQHIAAGIPMLPVRYEQIKRSPQAVFAKLFAYAGITVTEPAALTAVLARDSQQGTALGQAQQAEIELDAQALANMQAAIDWHPTIDRPDFIVPGTLTL